MGPRDDRIMSVGASMSRPIDIVTIVIMNTRFVCSTSFVAVKL